MIASYVSDLHPRADDGAFPAAQPARATRGARRVGRAAAEADRSPAFSADSKHYFERFRQGYLGLLQLALRHRLAFAGGLHLRRAAVARPCAVSRPGFLSARSIRRRSRSICAPRPGPASRKRPLLADQVEQKIRTIIPPDRLASIVDNIGLPISGINISYGNTGTIGVFDADILVTSARGGDSDRRLCENLARAAAEGVSGHDLLLSCRPTSSPRSSISARPRRSTSRSPAPISTRAAPSPTGSWRKYAMFPGVADPRIQEAFQSPALKVDFNRELAGVVGPHRG